MREKNLSPRSSLAAASSPPSPRPRHASFFPQFLRENGVKDFRLRFVAAFVPLCSFSSPLRAGLPPSSVLRKKLLSLPPRSFSFLRTLYLTFVSDSLFPEPRRCSTYFPDFSCYASFSFAWDCERNCIPAKFTPADCNVAINSLTGFRTARSKDEFPNSSTLS